MLSVLGVVVFGLLFASADALFAEWVDAVVPDLRRRHFVARAFVAAFVGGVVLGASYLALNPPAVETEAARAVRSRSGTSGWCPVLLVDAVFVRVPRWPRRR